MFPATVFDFNGLLVDDEHVHLEAFRDAVAPLGIVIGEQEYWEELLGYDDAGAFEALLRKAQLPVSQEEVVRLIEAKRPLYMKRARESLETFAGADRLVRTMAEHGPVAVVSGALTDEIVLGLEALGVSDCVQKIISAEDTTHSKPDPEGYVMAKDWLRKQGVQAERALVFEDSLDGIAAAKAAGLPTIAVEHSYPREQLEAKSPDAIFNKLDDVTVEEIAGLYRRLYG